VIPELLGWLNLILLSFNSALFALRIIVRLRISKTTRRRVGKALFFFRKMHPWTGGILLITSFLHGYMALNYDFAIHTGTLVFFGILAQFIVFVLGKTVERFKYKWIRVHGLLMFLTWIFVIIHLISPWSLYIPTT
jgi:cytochrome b561